MYDRKNMERPPMASELIQALLRGGAVGVDVEAAAEVALAFSKECLGWKNARAVKDWGYPYIFENVSREQADTSVPPYRRQFHYTHLDYVAKAVKGWIKPHDTAMPRHADV